MNYSITADQMTVVGPLNDNEIENLQNQGWKFRKAVFEDRMVKYLFEWGNDDEK